MNNEGTLAAIINIYFSIRTEKKVKLHAAHIMKKKESVNARVHSIQLVIIFFLLCLVVSIAMTQINANVLAKVGNKNVTSAEFKARCEFTVRPHNFKDKAIALNNLIIEKILASEAERTNTLNNNPAFHARLKGIKEQAMREKLWAAVAFNKATVDTAKLKTAYRLSMREYELEFYRMRKDQAQKVKTAIDSAQGKIDDVFKSFSKMIGKQPKHKIAYKDPEADTLHEALFSKPLNVGEVIGPIEIDYDDYLVMKVVNWTDYPLISGEDQRARWNEVQKKEHTQATWKLWREYRAEIMHGKNIEFNEKTFFILADWMKKKYFIEQQNKALSSNKISEIPFSASGLDLTLPFLTFESQVWTIGDFKSELMSRPLLFRSKDLDSANFNIQFKLAIADIMEDHCLTREAYKKSIDKEEDIARTIDVWKDSYLAHEQQKNVVDAALKEGKITKNDELGIHNYWESFVNDLQKKYRDSITVNMDVLQNISITNIDMIVTKPGMPYPLVVPDFPLFISSKMINYRTPKE